MLNDTVPPKGIHYAFNRPIFHDLFLEIFRLSWETSTQENLTPEALDRPETGLELLTRISSIRFFFHFLISSRINQNNAAFDCALRDAQISQNLSKEFVLPLFFGTGSRFLLEQLLSISGSSLIRT